MTPTVIVFSVLIVVLLGAALLLIPLGFRTGDKHGDALLVSIDPHAAPRAVSVALSNPGELPVIVGLSLRRRGLRLRLEGETYVRIRTRTTALDLLPAQQATLGIVEGRETTTVSVPADAHLGRRAELVVVVGQPGRLRTIHRLVCLPPLAAADLEARLDPPLLVR